MYEILKNEEFNVEKMTDDERQIYCQDDNNKIRKILAVQHPSVIEYVNVACTLNELHRIHQQFNEVDENVLFNDNLPAEMKSYVENLQYDNLRVTISIGNCSMNHSLFRMDDCDALYHFFGECKMNAFYFMLENVDIHHLTYYMFELD